MPTADRTSAVNPNAPPGRNSSIRPAAAAIAAESREAIEISAPSCAKTRATAKPKPRLAPETIATLPFSPKSITTSYLFVYDWRRDSYGGFGDLTHILAAANQQN